MPENQRYKKGSKDIDIANIISKQMPIWKLLNENATRDAKNRFIGSEPDDGYTLEQLQAKFTPYDEKDVDKKPKRKITKKT